MKVWPAAKAIAVHSKITDYVFYLGVSPYLAKELFGLRIRCLTVQIRFGDR